MSCLDVLILPLSPRLVASFQPTAARVTVLAAWTPSQSGRDLVMVGFWCLSSRSVSSRLSFPHHSRSHSHCHFLASNNPHRPRPTAPATVPHVITLLVVGGQISRYPIPYSPKTPAPPASPPHGPAINHTYQHHSSLSSLLPPTHAPHLLIILSQKKNLSSPPCATSKQPQVPSSKPNRPHLHTSPSHPKTALPHPPGAYFATSPAITCIPVTLFSLSFTAPLSLCIAMPMPTTHFLSQPHQSNHP